MSTPPPPQLLTTFRLASFLRLIGALTGSTISYVLVGIWSFDRWWMSILTSCILLFLLLPWGQWFPQHATRLTHFTLITALAFGIIAPHIDLVQSLHVPFEPLGSNLRFAQTLGWTQEQTFHVHALGLMFMMVAAMLASWQYGRAGLLGSLALAGFIHLLTPLFLPPNTFPWLLYAVQGFVLLGITLILAFTTYTLAEAEQKKQAELAEGNSRLALANQKLAQQAVMMEQFAAVQERNRLARELHDTLAHSLSGTAVQLQAVNTLLGVNPAAAKAELKVAQEQIKRGLTESRRAISALRDSTLEAKGLTAALRQRAEQLAQRTGLALQCDLDELPQLLPHLEQTLYRIADEALLNAEKYAQATRLQLDLRYDGEEIILTIWDDGVGFDPQTTPAGSHFGLVGMKERAELIGAELLILSQPTQGTQVELKIKHPTETP